MHNVLKQKMFMKTPPMFIHIYIHIYVSDSGMGKYMCVFHSYVS